MNDGNGRLEKEVIELSKVQEKLNDLPKVLCDFYYYLEAADRSYSTIKVYINYIINFMNYCTKGSYDENFYQNITSATINMYMSSLRYKTNKDKNIKRTGNGIRATRWSALNTFFIYLKSNGLIEENPMNQTFRPSCKQEKKVIYLTEDEIQQCIKNIEQNQYHKLINRDLCIFSLGISTGLRVSAIAQINISDIDFQESTIQVVEKGNKNRIIYFGNNLKERIIAWIEDRNKYFPDVETDALFISQKKNRLSVSAIEDLMAKYTKGMNKHITPHKLRATCATNLYKKTGDIYLVANQLGHANIATTKIYTEIDVDAKRKATNILDNLI